MKLVDTSIKKPVTVTVGVLLIVLFGILSLYRIPIQLTPNVDLPEVSIETRWEGASPVEVEREIIDVQEEQLKNLDGLVEMLVKAIPEPSVKDYANAPSPEA